MVAQKFGNADPDMRSRVGKGKTKEISDKPMERASARTAYTGLMGGPSNSAAGSRSEKKSGATMRFEKGGKVGAIPPHEEGGFRNAAMEHKR